MKKRILGAFVAAGLACFGLTGCADAVLNDGSNIRHFNTSNPNGGSGAVPFHMFNDKMDIQVWTDWDANAITLVQGDALVIRQTGAWYGIAICSAKNGSDSNEAARLYGMSDIKKITFEAMTDKEDGHDFTLGMCTEDGKSFKLTNEYQEFTYDVPSDSKHLGTLSKHYCMVSLVMNQAGVTGVTDYIRNIRFLDASGNEVVPEMD